MEKKYPKVPFKVVNKKPHKWRFKFFTENYAFEKILDFFKFRK